VSACLELERELGVKEKIKLVKSDGVDLFQHPIVKAWHSYFLSKWISNKPLAFLLPCTSKKPYSSSATHRTAYGIIRRLDKENKVQIYSVSEPMLLVPKELEECYPFNSYDYPPSLMVNEEKEEFINLLVRPLQKIGTMHIKIVGVLPNHHYGIVKNASERANVRIELIPYGKLAFKSIELGIRKLLGYDFS